MDDVAKHKQILNETSQVLALKKPKGASSFLPLLDEQGNDESV